MSRFRVRVDQDAIHQKKWSSITSMKFAEIKRLSGQNVHKIAYNECFLIIENDKGLVLEFGELDDGFDELEQTLVSVIGGPPSGWRAEVEGSEQGEIIPLWERG